MNNLTPAITPHLLHAPSVMKRHYSNLTPTVNPRPLYAPSVMNNLTPAVTPYLLHAPSVMKRHHSSLTPAVTPAVTPRPLHAPSVRTAPATAIANVEGAVVEVVDDLCSYIEANQHFVNAGQVKFLEKHGRDGLSQRFLTGMPTLLKIVAGQDHGVDYYAIAALAKDPSCTPDKNYVGSYFLLPAYGGETADWNGMRARAGQTSLAPTICAELQQPNDGRGRQSRTAIFATPVRSGSREKGFGQTERPARM
ncbi:hypothetical protein D6D23_08820 [Aureobasidium pullulans]|nr:hypothetical protein D6D23_08820 [Aureobasidium pullulans]